MAYYTKEEVKKFIDDSIVEIAAAGLQALIPESEAYNQLKNEEIVAFMWIDYKQGEIEAVKDVKMKGKAFKKIAEDLYTDDRYALDLHQANMQEINVEDVVNGRKKEQKIAKKTISQNSVDNVHKAFVNKASEED